MQSWLTLTERQDGLLAEPGVPNVKLLKGSRTRVVVKGKKLDESDISDDVRPRPKPVGRKKKPADKRKKLVGSRRKRLIDSKKTRFADKKSARHGRHVVLSVGLPDNVRKRNVNLTRNERLGERNDVDFVKRRKLLLPLPPQKSPKPLLKRRTKKHAGQLDASVDDLVK